jgi:hypothetical protein
LSGNVIFFAYAALPGREKWRFWDDFSHRLGTELILQRGVRAHKIGQKNAHSNAVKPFGNSQKGIGKGRLTWLVASEQYAAII